MHINIALEKIIGPFEMDQTVKVSFFIVSKKYPGLKKINLDKYRTNEERVQKLQKWALENRFVAVIEKGDQLFAHLNAQIAENLEKSENLTIDGQTKKITFNKLSDEQSEELSHIGQIFCEEIAENKELKEKEQARTLSLLPFMRGGKNSRQVIDFSLLASDPQMYKAYFIAKMKNIPDEIFLDNLRRLGEARREEEKLKEENDKYFAIKEGEIKKGIERSETVQKEVRSQKTKRDHLVQGLEFKEKRIKVS